MASIMDAGTPKLRVVTQLLALDTRLLRRLQVYWVGYQDTTMAARLLDWYYVRSHKQKAYIWVN